MTNKKLLIACSKNWFFDNTEVKKFLKSNKGKIQIISKRNDFSLKRLDKIQPDVIFFPHWSYLVEKKIIDRFKCICFHAAPLPYGRGGSPLQNLITKNFKHMPIYALKMTKNIDAGDIYLKQNLSLKGDLNDIFNAMALKILKMIKIILKKKIKPKKQSGNVLYFKRLKKSNSEITTEKSLNQIYDKIRMLDSDYYPRAFIKIGKFKVIFFKSVKRKNMIQCHAKIIK